MANEISLNEAAARGIERLRQSIWADPLDHIKLDIVDGKPGLWMHLFCPFNEECNGRDPVDILWSVQFGKDSADSKQFVPYEGPLPDSDTYKTAKAKYAGVLEKDGGRA